MAKNIKGVEINREVLRPWHFFLGFVAVYMLITACINIVLGFLYNILRTNEGLINFLTVHSNFTVFIEIIKTIFLTILVIYLALRVMFRYFKLEDDKCIKRCYTYYFIFYVFIVVLLFWSNENIGGDLSNVIDPTFLTQCVGIVMFPLYFGLMCVSLNRDKNKIDKK